MYWAPEPGAPHVPMGCDTPLINKESMISAIPENLSSSVLPVESKTSAESAKPRLVSESLPAWSAVSPVYELVAVSASVPAPVFVSPPVPETEALIVTVDPEAIEALRLLTSCTDAAIVWLP